MPSTERESRAALAARFAAFERTAGARAPLYAALAPRIADDDDLLALLDPAPAEQRLPVLLFAAVHLLVLEGLAPSLAAHYPNVAAAGADPDRKGRGHGRGDPFPEFRHAALAHAGRIRSIAATSTTQTNEVGRCAWLMPLAAAVSAEVGPVALVDVGTSAGLNLLMGRYHYEFVDADGSTTRLGDPAAAVRLACALRAGGRRSVVPPQALPDVCSALGIDAAPVDVHDEHAVRWLEACIWPDMVQRFERLVAAVELARSQPPAVMRGDAVGDLGHCLASAAAAGHPVVMTSWVLNYLSSARQREFVDVLDGIGRSTDLSWIVAESPAETPGLPVPSSTPPEEITVVSLVRWRRGRRTVERIATAHPHGMWLQPE